MNPLAARWPRVVEAGLAICFALSPWVLNAPVLLKWIDTLAAIAIVVVVIISAKNPSRLFNLWHAPVGAFLCLFPLLYSRDVHPAQAQAELLSGLLLLMFAVIPSRAMEVPLAWRELFEQHPELAEAERRLVLETENRQKR